MRRVTAGGIVLAIIASVVHLSLHHQAQPIVDRRPELRKLVAEQEAESAQAVARYVPTTKTRIDDLSSPVVDLLRDRHFVPKDLYAIAMKEAYGRDLTTAESDRLHQELLLEVELVQIEQMAMLRCLIKQHGLKKVFSEGFSPNDLEAFRERITVLKAMENEQLPQVRKQLEEVRKLVEGATGERREKAQAIESQLTTMLDENKHRLLEIEAAGRLLISGELEDVLPLEDADALEQAKPISPSGGVKLDPAKIEARHDAQVRAVIKEGPVAVIILGGAHDLTDSVRRHSGERNEYLRVTTKRFREISE